MKKLFVVVDMQNDFITGTLKNEEAEKIVEKIVDKIKSLDKDQYVIYLTQDTHDDHYLSNQEGKKLPIKHCVYNTWGWEIEPRILAALSGFSVYFSPKKTFGQLFWGNSKYESIELCGTCTDICVISNALILKAKYPETPITVYKDLCAGTTTESHNAAVLIMKNCQVEVK